MAEVKYISYEKFKIVYKIKKYCNNVQVNLYQNNIIWIGETEIKFDSKTKKFTETSIEYAKRIAKVRDIKDGIIIYRIVNSEIRLPLKN